MDVGKEILVGNVGTSLQIIQLKWNEIRVFEMIWVDMFGRGFAMSHFVLAAASLKRRRGVKA